jgi:hypothetical protein
MLVKKWSLADDTYLINAYKEKTARQIGIELGRTRASIKNRINKLALKLDPETREERCNISKFVKGQVPFNKGKKITEFMNAEAIEKLKQTQFKKGQIPHNVKTDGVITIRADKIGHKYQYIRIANNKWELYQRVVYEKHFGKIPADCNIRFKDGNAMNCEIENLQLITKTENMAMNTIQRFPPELIETIKLSHKLNKLILKKQNHGKK